MAEAKRDVAKLLEEDSSKYSVLEFIQKSQGKSSSKKNAKEKER